MCRKTVSQNHHRNEVNTTQEVYRNAFTEVYKTLDKLLQEDKQSLG